MLTGALCVAVVGRQEIICCVTMRRLSGGGALSLDPLGFLGYYQVRLHIYFLTGGIGWGSTYLTFGI